MRSDVLREFCAHPLLAGLCRDLVGPDVRLYWDQAVYKQPHSTEPVLWHQDNGYTFVEPQAYLTCWIALTDATPENGCVVVMPGAHRDGTLVHRDTPIGQECWGDDARAVEVPVRAGSIVVFTSLTPHCTGRNTTDDVRKAYIVQYAPDGAVAYRPQPDGSRGPAERQDDERRQYLRGARRLIRRIAESLTRRAALSVPRRRAGAISGRAGARVRAVPERVRRAGVSGRLAHHPKVAPTCCGPGRRRRT